MRRPDRWRRVFALVWAVLQVALPAAGVLGQAELLAASTTDAPSGHVEDRSGPGCRPVHPADCPRCQTLSTHAAGSGAPAGDWTWIATTGAALGDHVGPRGVAGRALPLSRAPPRLS